MTHNRFVTYCYILMLVFVWVATQCATVTAQSNDITAPALDLALKYARTYDGEYRDKYREEAVEAIRTTLDSGEPITVAVTEAAELIDLRNHRPALYNRLRAR